MKKSITILVLLALAAGGAFAQGIEMSAGGGLLFDYNARNGMKADTVLGDAYIGIKGPAIGGFLFFDATYVEVDLNFAYGMYSDVVDAPAGFFDNAKVLGGGGNWLQFGFGLLGKYPFNLGALTVFPLAGINYNYILSAEDDDGYNVEHHWSESENSDLSQFGFLFGGGVDFGLTEALFLRGELLFQLRLPSSLMKDYADELNEELNSEDGGGNADPTFGMGPRIKIGVGYKF